MVVFDGHQALCGPPAQVYIVDNNNLILSLEPSTFPLQPLPSNFEHYLYILYYTYYFLNLNLGP